MIHTDKSDLVTAYKKLNDSFKKTFVYHVGIDAGFFSEYNEMIIAMLYCLDKKIKFKLYSKDANFAFKEGLSDYFLPFCEQVEENYHSKYNRRKIPVWKKILKSSFEKKSIRPIKWKIKSESYIALAKVTKHKYKINYLTQDFNRFFFEKSFIQKKFHIPELNIDGDYITACSILFDITWHYNSETKKTIGELIQNLNLPVKYTAIQVRGGDKIIEFSLRPMTPYYDMLHNLKSCKEIYVLTDDYRIFEKLKEEKPNYNWYTLCKPEENGYYNSSFINQGPLYKKEKMTRFFASMELLNQSDLFIGTITATPGRYMLLRYYSKSFVIDYEKKHIPDSISLSMNEIRIISDSFLEKEYNK